MKAVYLTGVGTMEMREAPPPCEPQPQEVLLRTDTVGVCGSDIHYYRQGRIGPQVVEFPAVLGHEFGATVMQMGAEVKDLRVGQRVAVDPLVPCGECDQCRVGRKNTCRNQLFMGNPGQVPGALREYLVMPAACCKPLPDSVTDDEAALVEPLSIGVYAAELAQLKPGSRVGIVGSGPIGLCTLLAAQASMAGRVYVTDLVHDRLKAARAAGAVWAGNPQGEDVVAAIHKLEPLGLDMVFECAGEQEAIDQAVQLLKPGGTLLIVGIPEVDRVSFDINTLRRNELRILNVRRQNECVGRAIELIASRRVNVQPLITHHFPLGETARAFDLVSARRDGVIKAMIRVGQEDCRSQGAQET